MSLARPLLPLIFFASACIMLSGQLQSDNWPQLLEKYREADHLFQKAESNVSETEEESLNRRSLELFRALTTEFAAHPLSDSLAFHTWFRIGVLEHYFENIDNAKDGYLRSISLSEKAGIIDSLVFKPYLYLGIILYSEMKFDSAIAVYKKAELIADKYGSSLDETERLYNTLGAIYYETGNYRQAKNYLEKSISLLSPTNPSYRELLVNYKVNLASTLTKLEEFGEAVAIYQQLLPMNIHRDIILHNTGVINLNLGSVEKALSFFRQVNPSGTNRVRLYNDMAIAFYNLRQYDSALQYVNRAIASRNPSLKKSIPFGQTLKIHGDVLVAQGNVDSALMKYQQAITQFYSDFNEGDVYKDPVEFSGLFSYINLFNALISKADAFEQSYRSNKELRNLIASLNAYRSAFKLADYVEKSYTSDEARLFLNKVKYVVHSRPIDVSLALFELTKEKQYLEDAYMFDQHNKGSVISLSIQENELKRRAGINDTLSQKEFELRSAITRLSLKAAQVSDSATLNSISSSIRDHEIQLGKLQERMNANAAISKPAERIPAVKDIQRMLDKHSAFLSYHLSEKDIVILCITKNVFTYRKVTLSSAFITHLNKFTGSLRDMSSGEQPDAGAYLYDLLIEPINDIISEKDRLIINPDDELNYLPFECLKDSTNKYLLQKHSVLYHYAAAMLTADQKAAKGTSVLAIAPFIKKGYADSTVNFSKLPYSFEETRSLPGQKLFDSIATKQNFIRSARAYPILHLATHSVVNDRHPLQSFIAFYPDRTQDSSNYKLYAGEIYNLNLDSTRLVILSACETGAGELVRGEGLMSLTRAFAYAGCGNIVTSLWKAEDRTTAFITKQLHYYIENGDPVDVALRKAKIDLLESSEIDPRLKSPAFWAHLLFIGHYESNKPRLTWLWIMVGIAMLTTVGAAITLRKKRDRKP